MHDNDPLVWRTVLQQYYNRYDRTVHSRIRTMIGLKSNQISHAGNSTFVYIRNNDKAPAARHRRPQGIIHSGPWSVGR